jgi:hypothetical protein
MTKKRLAKRVILLIYLARVISYIVSKVYHVFYSFSFFTISPYFEKNYYKRKQDEKKSVVLIKLISNVSTNTRVRIFYFLSIKICLVVTQNVLLFSHKLLGSYSNLKKELVQQQRHQLN